MMLALHCLTGEVPFYIVLSSYDTINVPDVVKFNQIIINNGDG